MAKMTSLPGPRYEWQGEGSGEEFRDGHLLPAFNQALERGETLTVDMEGAEFGYPTSFLEEAFGGLSRICGTKRVQESIEIRPVSDDPYLVDEILHYVQWGEVPGHHPFIRPGKSK